MRIEVIEGNGLCLDGGALFGNAPKALWTRWVIPDEKNLVSLACRCLLVRTDGGKNVLFETGAGAFFPPNLRERYGIEDKPRLLTSLRELGVEEEQIDAVVLSHLHFDHAGGLLSVYGEEPRRLLFPKARYFVGRAHWKMALAPQVRERGSFIPELHALLEDSGRLCLVEGAGDLSLGISLSVHFFQGHTKGLMVSLLETEEGPLAFVSDLIPGLAWVRASIAMGYDRFAELAVQEKARFLELLYQRGGRLFFTHDLECICARVEKGEGRFIAVPCALT